jgi:hypothetical protein
VRDTLIPAFFSKYFIQDTPIKGHTIPIEATMTNNILNIFENPILPKNWENLKKAGKSFTSMEYYKKLQLAKHDTKYSKLSYSI